MENLRCSYLTIIPTVTNVHHHHRNSITNLHHHHRNSITSVHHHHRNSITNLHHHHRNSITDLHHHHRNSITNVHHHHRNSITNVIITIGIPSKMLYLPHGKGIYPYPVQGTGKRGTPYSVWCQNILTSSENPVTSPDFTEKMDCHTNEKYLFTEISFPEQIDPRF